MGRNDPAKRASDDDASQDWVAAGLAELATTGVDGVRIEVLAERLGVTKGGFYRRYRDRRALLNAILESWRDGRVAAIERQAESGADTPAGKLRAIFRIYTERANTQGIAIELAIRQWARSDPIAAAAAEAVDEARLKVVGSLYRSLGLSVTMTAQGLKLSLPRVSASCDFMRPVFFEDRLDIAITLEKIGRSSLTYLFDFYKSGEHIARGKITAACCQETLDKKLKAIEIPASIREKLVAVASAEKA